MIPVIGDYETRSRVDLKSTNVHRYAAHPSTEVLCFGYQIEGYDRQLWEPGDPFPFEYEWPNIKLLAFNAEFELVIWNLVCVKKYGWPKLPPQRVECLQARASYAGLPRSLEKVGDALGLGKFGKDMEGHKVTLELCKPHRGKLVGCEYIGGKFVDDPTKHARNFLYCDQDVVTESLVERIAPPLPKFEQELWQVHQRINRRGVPVDVALARNAHTMVNREMARMSQRLAEMTDGKITTPNQIARINEFCAEQGFAMGTLRKDVVESELQHPNIPPAVKEVLTIRQLCRDAAVAKYEAIINHEEDGRCRAGHVYYKAGPGRWAGAGPQFQNFRRLDESKIGTYNVLADTISRATPEELIEIYEELRATEKGVIPTLGSMVRMAVCAREGYKLVTCDFAGIEFRALHWLAGDTRTLKIIADYDNGKGADPYKIAAATIYNKKVEDITKAERQVGKVQILGCGYMTGAEKFLAFCLQLGIDMDLEKAQHIVQMYRRSYPEVVGFWYGCGKKAIRAIQQGTHESIGPVEFYMTGHTFNVRLPSGREMKYYDASTEDGMYGPEIVALDQRSGLRKTVGLPVLIENIDQGHCRDLLAHALVRCDREGLPIVFHVHDSIAVEAPEAEAEAYAADLLATMCEVPSWAQGFPIAGKIDRHPETNEILRRMM